MMYLRIHESAGGRIVAVCDEDLVGKVLEGKGAVMDLDRYRSFYVGKKSGEAGVRKALARFSSANLVGKEAVGVALSMGAAKKVTLCI